jgi:hypothetical protein
VSLGKKLGSVSYGEVYRSRSLLAVTVARMYVYRRENTVPCDTGSKKGETGMKEGGRG